MGCGCGERIQAEEPLPQIIAWQVWYVGGRVFRSADITWTELPDDGVLGVKLCEARTAAYCLAQNLAGYDWYFLADDVYGGNNDPPEMTQVRYPGVLLKRGQWTTAAEMARVTREMATEDFQWVLPCR